MIICLCHRVSDRDLRHHAGSCAEFEELQVCTGAGTGCGQCVGHARAIFEHTRSGREAERPIAWHASLAAVAA
ncbi:MAG TPA: (2Fe-2S)-binding protein [Methylibium sp.]|nr:(2Fe-2S)-binding protein [Methylibium sp.]